VLRAKKKKRYTMHYTGIQYCLGLIVEDVRGSLLYKITRRFVVVSNVKI